MQLVLLSPLSDDNVIRDPAWPFLQPAGPSEDPFTMPAQDSWLFKWRPHALVNSANTEAQLSVGWSGVNLTPGRMKAGDCSGLLHNPGHAYSVVGPRATTEGEDAGAPCAKTKSQTFHLFLSLLSLSLLFYCPPLCASLCLSASLHRSLP